jgi:hypothetical protein
VRVGVFSCEDWNREHSQGSEVAGPSGGLDIKVWQESKKPFSKDANRGLSTLYKLSNRMKCLGWHEKMKALYMLILSDRD